MTVKSKEILLKFLLHFRAKEKSEPNYGSGQISAARIYSKSLF